MKHREFWITDNTDNSGYTVDTKPHNGVNVFRVIDFDVLLEKLNEIKNIHLSSTQPMDDYFRGMFNGMETFLSLIEDREPNFANTSKNDTALK